MTITSDKITSPQRSSRRRLPTTHGSGPLNASTPPTDGSVPQPPRLRRRPTTVIVSAALVVVGAMGSAWAYSTSTDTVQVVAVRTDIAQGGVIDRDDLQLVRISVDPALRVVPADRLDTLVGQHAAVALTSGSLISDRAVTDADVPAPGDAVVGLSLGAGQIPSEALQVGDPVRIVSTPNGQGDVDPSKIIVFAGEVVAVGATEATDTVGNTAVSVQVSSAQAPELAARSATGKVALVLDARER